MNLKKSKFLNILIEIYSIYDINYLLKLIKTKYGKEFSREILDLLINNKIKFNDLSFNDEIELYNFQKTLLSVSDKKEEVNFIIKFDKSLYKNLIFIKDNFKSICKILEANSKVYRWKSTNYQLSLEPRMTKMILIKYFKYYLILC